MPNQIRHTALERLQHEAAQLGANSVVDVKLRIIPMSGAVELFITGTASHHPRFSTVPASPEQVVTSELTGEELWNLAQMGYAPVRLVMATSIYSLGSPRRRGNFPEHQSGQAPKSPASSTGRARLPGAHPQGGPALRRGTGVGNELMINDLGGGVIDVIGVGTAVHRLDAIKPATPTLIPRQSSSIASQLAWEARCRPARRPPRWARAPRLRFLVVALIRYDDRFWCLRGNREQRHGSSLAQAAPGGTGYFSSNPGRESSYSYGQWQKQS